MGEFNSKDHFIFILWAGPLRINGVTLAINRRVQNVALVCSLKDDRMISVNFQGKLFNITVSPSLCPNN